MEPHSIYLHIPFCRHRCGYCDFNTFAGLEDRIPAYIEALIQEIRQVAGGMTGKLRIPVHTVFFGGGTPSLIPADLLGRVTACLREVFDLLPGYEMTLEANPGTVSASYLRELRRMGFNRLSYGMQSARPDELRLLERQHTVFDVIEAVQWAREAGFDNLSLDLIYGLPYQTLADWQQTVEMAVRLKPQHLSLYALTIEEGTPLFRLRRKGLIAEPEDDLAADMYEWSAERLETAGFAQYEISNWARRDAQGTLLACRHNLQYWLARPYFGFGAGAHGYVGEVRAANVRGVNEYIRRIQQAEAHFPLGAAVNETWAIDRRTAMQEMMMLGLRLVESGDAASHLGKAPMYSGVERADFFQRFDTLVEDVFGKELRDLEVKGLLEETRDRIRLTPRGRLLGNLVFMQFIGD